jgi:type VI secretion system lysozyme-like protein
VEPRDQQGGITKQQLRPVHGRRVLLFDRLDTEEVPVSDEPYRVEDWSSVRQSVAREIQSLLNTRLPPGRWEAISEPQTAIDYGIPDFSALSSVDETDRRNLAEVLARKIASFEPRLSEVRLELRPHPTDQCAMTGTIEANLSIESLTRPVSFALQVSVEGEMRLRSLKVRDSSQGDDAP